ncbi:MAG: hypothetical protein ACO3FE_05390, partial [Planctomycetaceae bacterium]
MRKSRFNAVRGGMADGCPWTNPGNPSVLQSGRIDAAAGAILRSRKQETGMIVEQLPEAVRSHVREAKRQGR